MIKHPRVLVLFDSVEPTTIDQDLSSELKTKDWETESNVLKALTVLGFPNEHVAIYDNADFIRKKVEAFQPDVIFNLADQFMNNRAYDRNIVSFLEMQGVPFTGCGSTGLMLCKHKGISKKILSYHSIRVPRFAIFPRRIAVARTKKLRFPLIVKPLQEEASLGISQASLVDNDKQLRERVAFVHAKCDDDAIAEEYAEGRELYVSVMGNRRLRVFPIREMKFAQVPEDEPRFATYKAKWDENYRKKWGIRNGMAAKIDPGVTRKIEATCRRIYKLLLIDGYGRIDLRLTPENEIVFIEANPNPILARDEDFARSARAAGIEYPQLIQEIIRLGMHASRE
jgi:D-alanine-D-alanine ligase